MALVTVANRQEHEDGSGSEGHSDMDGGRTPRESVPEGPPHRRHRRDGARSDKHEGHEQGQGHGVVLPALGARKPVADNKVCQLLSPLL